MASYNWFRAYHGISSDPKWPMIARRSGQSVAVVLAVWMSLLDYASQNEPRGSIEGFVPEDIDALMGLEDGITGKVLQAMQNRGMIVDGYILAWEKRQANRAPSARVGEGPAMSSTERSRRYRERQRMQRNATACNDMQRAATRCNEDATPCNASATDATAVQRTDKIREDKRRIDIDPPLPPLGETRDAAHCDAFAAECDSTLASEAVWESDADSFAGIPAEAPADREQALRDLGEPAEGAALDDVPLPGEEAEQQAAPLQPEQPAKKSRRSTGTRRSRKQAEPVDPIGFAFFMAFYPNGDDLSSAKKAWNDYKSDKERAGLSEIFAALAWQRMSRGWTKEEGQFIPKASTYLRNRRWTDPQRARLPQGQQGSRSCNPAGNNGPTKNDFLYGDRSVFRSMPRKESGEIDWDVYGAEPVEVTHGA